MRNTVIITLLLYYSSAFAATPTISNVSGTIANGQTLTIAGTNMVNENKTNWDSYFTTWPNSYGFEGSSALADGYQDLRGGSDCIDCGTYDTSVKLMGNKSIQFHTQGSHAANLTSYVAVPFSGNDLWVRFYSCWNLAGGNWPDSHIKMLYDMSGGYYFQPSPTGDTLPMSMQAKGLLPDVNASYDFSIPSGQLQNNRWYLYEVHWKNDSSPHVFDAWMDNTKIIAGQGDPASSDLLYLLLGVVNECCSVDPNFSLYEWIDGFAFGSSRIYPSSIIEISGDNGSNWKYQPPTSISDTSISITANLPTLTADNYLLRVTNNRQETSSTYNLGGGGGDTTPPTTNISISSPQAISSDSLVITGTASDNTGVSGCKWRIGAAPDASNGTACTGTTSFSCSTYGYSSGSNTAYVGCYDVAGNYGSDSITVNYTPPSANLLLSESFDDTSFAARGWYDGSPSSIATSGCQAGSGCLQWTFNASGTNPTQMPAGAFRHTLSTATDTLYLSYYIKFATGWRGSQQTYHPHILQITSDLDYQTDPYTPLAYNYLQTYSEFISDVGSPYIIRPAFALQDERNVNTSYGTPPNDLSSTTENRSVNYCNTPVSTGASGVCYPDITYYSASTWKNTGVSVTTNTWHHVEMYLKMNTISGNIGQHDGVMREWIDGVQVFNYTDVLYRTNQHPNLKWQLVNIAPYIGNGSPIAQSFFIDNLTVWDGIPGAVATPPSPPTGLLVYQVIR